MRGFETTGRLPDVLRQTVEEFRESVIAEPDQFAAVCAHLPPDIQPIVKFAYITGWRIQSEVLPLEWRRVDFSTGDVRLDAGTTKNKKPRVIKMTDDLRALLAGQHVEHERVKKAGHICPFVFFREVADERGGEKKPRQVKAFTKSWKIACQAAGCPGRIPHDLRRTAVRNMVRRGIPEGVAMKWTGHTTRSIFERYNIVSEGDMTAAAERLNGLLGPSIHPLPRVNAPDLLCCTLAVPHDAAPFTTGAITPREDVARRARVRQQFDSPLSSGSGFCRAKHHLRRDLVPFAVKRQAAARTSLASRSRRGPWSACRPKRASRQQVLGTSEAETD